jgi:hypothetical protein
MFEGNLFNLRREYHSYVTESQALEAIGISVYSRSSLNNFFTQSRELTNEIFGTGNNALSSLLGTNAATPTLLYFNNENKKYEIQTGSDIFQDSGVFLVGNGSLSGFLGAVDNFYLSKSTNEDTQKIINKIQNSYSGCITFNTSVTMLGATENVLVKVYINSPQNSEKRTLAIRGEPLVAAVPSTAGGTKYSPSANLGVVDPPKEGGDSNPQNAVAANMRLTYNPALGSFESGTQQVLVRLLEDIDPPDLQGVSDIDLVDSIPISEFYDVESPYYVGNFTVGQAVIINAEKGNPHMFGPTSVDGCKDQKKEQITVVNRMPYSYSKGNIVLCSLIGNEWVINTPGSPGGQRNKLASKKWSFSKFVMNSDIFCREYQTGEIYTPDYFENYARLKFYDSQKLGDNLTTINNYKKTFDESEPHHYFDEDDIPDASGSTYKIPTFITSNRFIGVNNFYQVSKKKGGDGLTTEIGRTNIYKPSLNKPLEEGAIFSEEIPHFWGCVFVEGYSAGSKGKLSSITSLNSSSYDLSLAYASGYGYLENIDINSFIDKVAISKADILSDENSLLVSGNGLFSNTEDSKLLQLPAEIAMNGSIKSIAGFPNEKLIDITDYTLANLYSYLIDNDRYFYISDSGGINAAYDLKPTNPLRVQFSPLQLDYATYAFFDQSQSSMSDGDKSKISNIGDRVFNVSKEFSSSSEKIKFASDTEHNANGPVNGPQLYPISDNTGMVPGASPGEKSNVVGLIIATHTFSASTSISFSTDQYFGLPIQQTVGSAEGFGLTFIPIGTVGVAFGISTGGGGLNSRPQWGSYDNDRHYDFGTTALHVRVFDSWPKEQTIVDPRYYGILHFNPGLPGDKRVKPSGGISTPVDFTEPTASGSKERIPDNTIIGSGYQLAPVSDWAVNTIRRGQLLTGGGFRYYKRQIGVSNSFTVISMGSNTTVGQVFKLSNRVEIEITRDDKIKILNRGQGFVPSNFGTKHTVQTNNATSEYFGISMNFGSGGRIIFHNGIVYKKILYDAGPKEHTSEGPLKLSLDSNRGQGSGKGVAVGVKRTALELSSNPKKTYDAFYWFHNDILNTPMWPSPFVPGYAQYITLSISAG